MWPFSRKAGAAKDAPVTAAAVAVDVSLQVSVPAKAVEKTMSFLGVLEAIGKEFEKGLVWAVKYALPVEKAVALIFPPALPVVTEMGDALTLIQNAVMMVEQKYAAQGKQSGTGAQKAADVLVLTQQAVTALLVKAGVANVQTDYIQGIISAVVSILNVQQYAGAVPTATPAAA